MKVGDCEVDVSEVMIHFLIWRDTIESQWGTSMWNARTGTNKDGSSITYEDDVKDDILEEMKVEKTLVLVAGEQKITLTEEEQEDCRTKAEEVIRGFDNEEVISYGITLDKVANYYEDIALMSKLCGSSMDDLKKKYNKKEYEMTTVYGAIFPTYQVDQEGNSVEMSANKKKKVLEQAQKAREEIESGASIEDIVEEFHLKYAGEKSFSAKADEDDTELYNQIKKLKDGEYSQVLTLEQGYGIIKMVHRVDEEKTKEALEKEIEDAQRKLFLEYYTDKYKDKYHTRIEEDIWDALPLASNHDES
jgi:Asp-tRNA(Asn)/Glu-tRNA(Gln) amidotransferase A subunit family amidase